MPKTIHIVSVPEGEGHLNDRYPLPGRRSAFVGCRFPLADPQLVQETELLFFRDLSAPATPAYSVTFADAVSGLKQANRYDLADYISGLTHRPRLLRFPVDCARLIEA